MQCFHERNFGGDALANRLMGTRFDIEVCRHFHKDVFKKSWLEEGKELNRALSLDTADGLQEIVDFVKTHEASPGRAPDGALGKKTLISYRISRRGFERARSKSARARVTSRRACTSPSDEDVRSPRSATRWRRHFNVRC